MIRRVATGVGVNIFDKIAVAGTQLLQVPVLASAWGLHLYGLWILLATVPSFLAMGDLGFATAAGTKMTMAAAHDNRSSVIIIFQSAWAAILCSSGVLVTLALALALMLPAGLFGRDSALPIVEARATLLLLMLYGIVVIQGGIFFAGFRAAGLFATGAFCNALILLCENSALIVSVVLGAKPVVAAAVLLGARLVGLAGQSLLLQRRVPWLKIGLGKASRSEVVSLLRPAGAVMLLPIAQACALQGTAVALGAAAGQAAVPVFTAARTLSRVGLQLCWILNTALMPEFSRAAARDDRRAMATMVLATLAFSAVLVVPFATGFAVLGRPFILFWSNGVIHAPQQLLVIMALGVLFSGFWYPISNLILAVNRHGTYTCCYVLLASLAVPATYLLSSRAGVAGAGFVLMLLDLIMLIVVTSLARWLLVSMAELKSAIPAARIFLLTLPGRLRIDRA